MFKRFVMGFIIGVAGMYWYIYHGDTTWSDAEAWLTDSASEYRGDARHESADAVVGD